LQIFGAEYSLGQFQLTVLALATIILSRVDNAVRVTSLLLGIISFLFVATALTETKGEEGPKQPSEGDTEIRTALQRLYAAWSDLDPAKTAKFYAKDADLTFFDVAPLKYTGWSEYAGGVPIAFADYRSGKFTLNDDLTVHRQGSLAWATSTWQAELTKKDGSNQHMEGRYTAVLEKRGKDWLVIHEHMSMPLQ
jgi:ketosteroid isomerase-like protein